MALQRGGRSLLLSQCLCVCVCGCGIGAQIGARCGTTASPAHQLERRPSYRCNFGARWGQVQVPLAAPTRPPCWHLSLLACAWRSSAVAGVCVCVSDSACVCVCGCGIGAQTGARWRHCVTSPPVGAPTKLQVQLWCQVGAGSGAACGTYPPPCWHLSLLACAWRCSRGRSLGLAQAELGVQAPSRCCGWPHPVPTSPTHAQTRSPPRRFLQDGAFGNIADCSLAVPCATQAQFGTHTVSRAR